MNLVLDFGNSLQKCAIFDDNRIIKSTSFKEISVVDLIEFVDNQNIKSAILSSVIHDDNSILAFLTNAFKFIKLDSQTPIPINNCYKTPGTLGKDRLAAAIGAWSLYKGINTLSVDCGTALKFDFVDSGANYLGGSISPGFRLRFKSLNTFTDKLPLINFENHEDLIGIDTRTSILSGVINGLISEIDGMITRYMSEYSDLKVVVTGGEMFYFEKRLKSNIFAEPNLVLLGLNEILKFNDIY